MTETMSTSSTGGMKGVKAERYSLMPRLGLDAVARVFAFGEAKYAAHNWRRGYEWSKSIDALLRHVNAFNDGETLDSESGLPHLSHAGFHVLVLLTWLAEQGEGGVFDDRYAPPAPEPPAVEDPVVDDLPGSWGTPFLHTADETHQIYNGIALRDSEGREFEGPNIVAPEEGPVEMLLPEGWTDVGYTTLDESWFFPEGDDSLSTLSDLLSTPITATFEISSTGPVLAQIFGVAFPSVEDDIAAVRAYVEEQIELVETPVVSIRPMFEMTDEWFERVVVPLLPRHFEVDGDGVVTELEQRGRHAEPISGTVDGPDFLGGFGRRERPFDRVPKRTQRGILR